MLEFFRALFSTSDFMPHGMCFLWDPITLWLNVLADSLTAAAYYTIPFLLMYFFARRRQDIPFKSMYLAFLLFILACGTTHLLGAVTVWHPIYRLDGVVKAVTALASVATCLMLIPLMPSLISLPSPAQLENMNRTLAAEIEERKLAENQVRTINEELEQRVAARTADLEKVLHELRREMDRRSELEDQLIQAQKMEAVGRLAGGVAHDFNNLLTVILGYNEMLREHAKEDPVALDFAQEILRASQRASDLTNQLLAFSRRQVAVPRVVDINELVLRVEKMLGRIIGEDIELKARLDPVVSRVKVDPAHFDQVILNLAVNSRDAMPGGGSLTIETANVLLTDEYAGHHLGAAPGQYVMLAVSDTGSGMDAETKSRVFEPFFTTKEKGKGTGLGLSIVYGIVKQNGGEILVYSEPGQGTVFKIYLPAVLAPAEVEPEIGPEEVVTPATETILLVEDEEQVRSLTRTMLVRQGYKVLEADSPAEALRLAREHPEGFDLLLTDIVMPQMSGMALAQELKASYPRLKLLYMSGYTDTGLGNQGIITADTPFIQKPFTSADLHRKLREVLR
jgi:signal transduction histidine kinase/CheY-like chemotaxis protein